MKIRNILTLLLSSLIIFSCSEDESFKELNTQVFIYPIEEIEDGVIDRLVELAYDESSEREVTVRIAIHPTQPSPTTVSYEFRSVDDPEVVSATEGVDFEVLSDKTVTIPANQEFVDVSFRVLNDLDAEPDEEFIFYLTDAGDRTLLEGSRQYRFTIRESDQPVVAFVSDDSETFLEGDEYNYTIEISEELETDLTVNYTVSGSATSGADYAALPGSVFFPAGETEVDIPIDLASADGLEWDETIVITLTSVDGNGAVADPDDEDIEGTITIEDNSLNPPVDDLGFALVWEDATTANLELTLWDSDTVEVTSSNNPADFESLILAEAQPNGTYYVTASWVGGTADEADFAAYIGTNGYNQSERIEDTIEPTNTKADDPIFLYVIDKADTYTVVEEED